MLIYNSTQQANQRALFKRQTSNFIPLNQSIQMQIDPNQVRVLRLRRSF